MVAALLHRVYNTLTALYPSEFRREHRADMVLLFDELVKHRGVATAIRLTMIDLLVTLPRYRLEAVMTGTNATRVLNAGIAGLVVLGIIGLMLGAPPWLSLASIGVGLVLVLADRTRLARSIRPSSTSQRVHRLRMAALSAGIFAVCLVAYFIVVSGDEVTSLGLLGTSVSGMVALLATIGFLVAGLLTPRTDQFPAQ